MRIEAKSTIAWIAYATALVLASASLHAIRSPGLVDAKVPPHAQASLAPPPPPEFPDPVPPPLLPVLTASVEESDLDGRGVARIHFRLDRPAERRLVIGLSLEARGAGLDGQLATEPGPGEAIVIEEGRSEAQFLLRKSKPKPPPAVASRGARAQVVTVATGEEKGFEWAAKSRRKWEFPLTTVDYGTPFLVELSAPAAFRVKNARLKERVTVTFALDRKPTDHAIEARFRIEGGKTDHRLVDPPSGDLVRFLPGQSTARIVLERIPGPRGLGDREIRVECLPMPGGELAVAPGRGSVAIGVPDPKSTFSWSIEPPSAVGPRAQARLIVSVSPPPSARAVFRYRVVGPARGPSERTITFDEVDPWGVDSIRASQIVESPVDDLVAPRPTGGARGAKVRLEPIGENSSHLAALDVKFGAVGGPIHPGAILAIVVLTEELAGDDRLIGELLKVEAGLGPDRLVGRSLLVLDGNQQLFRLRAGSIGDRTPFPRGSKIGQVLTKETKATLLDLFDALGGVGADRKVLILRDVEAGEPGAEDVIRALNDCLAGPNWWAYWIGPESQRPTSLATIRDRVKLKGFDRPKGGLAAELLGLLDKAR